MCSISTVTTSQSFANAMTSAASWNEPSVGIATMDAGDTGFGSRERTRTPMGAPRDGQHAPELTAAEDADLRRARQTVGGHRVHRPVALAAVEQAGGGPRGAPDGDAVRGARERASRVPGPGGDPDGRAEGGGG